MAVLAGSRDEEHRPGDGLARRGPSLPRSVKALVRTRAALRAVARPETRFAGRVWSPNAKQQRPSAIAQHTDPGIERLHQLGIGTTYIGLPQLTATTPVPGGEVHDAIDVRQVQFPGSAAELLHQHGAGLRTVAPPYLGAVEGADREK